MGSLKLNRTRIVLAFVVVAFAFSIITLLFWDFVRDSIIVPVYYVIWVGGLFLKSIPQSIFIGILVLISLVIGLNTLRNIRLQPNTGGGKRKPQSVDTRYLHWKRLYDNLYISRFSRTLFNSESRKLILSILAYENGIDSTEAEARTKRGTLNVPDGIRNLLQQRDFPDAAPPSRLQSLRQRLGRIIAPPNPQVDALVAEVITFVEQHLETPYGGNQHES